jgi:putative Mn2+ efflux pump MntP
MFSVATLALAFGLSADAFAASLAKGAQHRHLSFRRTAVIAACFAVLEVLAPLAGWFAGREFGHLIAAWDHWVAFGLLSFLGLRMLRLREDAAREESVLSAPAWGGVLAVALGTSADAATVGVTLALVMDEILPVLTAIGAVTFAMAWVGLRLGRIAGAGLGRLVERAGGVLLIGIGVKILVEHLTA